MHRLHALDVTTGLEKTGSPDRDHGELQYDGKNNVFEDVMQVNRPALLLENGYLYIAFGSNGCRGDYEQGWVMSPTTLRRCNQTGAFDDEPGESAAAVWMRGGGLSADSQGNIYGATADGPFAAGTNFGQSVFKLSQSGNTLQLADWFTPFNETYLDQNDLDMSEPVLVLPKQAGQESEFIGRGGKGRHDLHSEPATTWGTSAPPAPGDTQIVQELTAFAPEGGALVYWNNAIYTSATGAPIAALALANGKLAQTPFAQSKKVDSGHSPVISANGNTSAFCGSSPGTLCLRLTRSRW